MKRITKYICLIFSFFVFVGGICLLTLGNRIKINEETRAANFIFEVATKSYYAGSSQTSTAWAGGSNTSRVNNGNCFTVQWREDENNNAKNFDSTLYYNGTSDGGGRSEVTGISTFYYHYDSWISMVRRHGNIVITYHPSNSTGWKFCGVYSSESSSNGTSINYNYTWYKYGSSAPTTSSSGWKATSDMSGRCYVIYRYRYKLVFNGNGGTTNLGNQYFLSGTDTATTTAEIPSRTGYEWVGWNRNKNATTAQYRDQEVVKDTSSDTSDTITLYAIWKPQTYTIKLDKQSGSGGTSTIYLKYNTGWYSNSSATTSISSISKPSRTGYTFQGYYTNTNGSGTKIIDSTGKIVGSNTYIASGDTLYAYWTPNIYTISLNKQSGSNGTSTIYLKYNTGWYSNSAGTTSISAITKPTRTGYIFQGYYTSTSGGGSQIINSNGNFVSGRLTYTTANDTLYAYWTPISYSINFDIGDGSWTSSSPTNNTQYDKAINVPAPQPPTGYTFAGWTSGTNFNSSTAQSGTSETSTTSWSGSLTKNTYFKNLTTNNGTTVTLVANYTPNSYYIRFNGNGNTGGSMSDQLMTYDKSANLTDNGFTKTGYDFVGWATSASGNKVYNDKANVKNLASAQGDIYNLYAVWSPAKYTVTFDPNEGSVSPTTKSVTYDSTYGDLPIPTRAGWIFIGWYTTKDGGTQVLSNTKVQTAKAHSLFAHWQDTWASHVVDEDEPSLKVSENPNTKDNPYIIDTPGKLAWLAMQAQTKNLSGYYEQTKNIELDDYIWLPIGTNTYSFTGYYDGKGYTIEGLHTAETTEVSNSTSVNSYVGLFGRTNGAKLNNIYVKEAKIYGHTNVGGIVGYASGSTVLTSCGFSGTISAQANSGALIGSSASGVQITDCIVFSADVDKLNSGSATTTSTVYVLNGKKGCSSGEFANWVFVSGMPYPVPKGLSWLAQGGNQASLTDIQNWVNS